ncbi:MAG: hypothetical protein LBQ11_01345 [Candidatus Nomurabacteria bacterium]|jgi:hypothetical protein|nr:hypothetical protein [Candidatus Nomurabacteria bacterium]
MPEKKQGLSYCIEAHGDIIRVYGMFLGTEAVGLVAARPCLEIRKFSLINTGIFYEHKTPTDSVAKFMSGPVGLKEAAEQLSKLQLNTVLTSIKIMNDDDGKYCLEGLALGRKIGEILTQKLAERKLYVNEEVDEEAVAAFVSSLDGGLANL